MADIYHKWRVFFPIRTNSYFVITDITFLAKHSLIFWEQHYNTKIATIKLVFLWLISPALTRTFSIAINIQNKHTFRKLPASVLSRNLCWLCLGNTESLLCSCMWKLTFIAFFFFSFFLSFFVKHFSSNFLQILFRSKVGRTLCLSFPWINVLFRRCSALLHIWPISCWSIDWCWILSCLKLNR